MTGHDWLLRIGAVGLGLVMAGHAALAEDEYAASTGQVLAIEIRPTAPEVDALLDATCVASNTIDIRFGGEYPFGKGKREPTSLTLTSGGLSTKIDGVSVDSPDDEMTGGVMLLTSVEPDGKTMQILSSGKEIVFKLPDGTSEKVTLGKAVTEAVKKFVKDCANSASQ
jgi:hypothetical protein